MFFIKYFQSNAPGRPRTLLPPNRLKIILHKAKTGKLKKRDYTRLMRLVEKGGKRFYNNDITNITQKSVPIMNDESIELQEVFNSTCIESKKGEVECESNFLTLPPKEAEDLPIIKRFCPQYRSTKKKARSVARVHNFEKH